MKLSYENHVKEIKKIIETKAKYQKVMLLFDDSVSNVEIIEIYNEIKGLCMYNQSNIKDLNKEEIFNGYRLIIYFCMVDNFLKCDFEKDEFINVFVPRDNALLPYFLSNKNEIEKADNVLILNKSRVDVSAVSSVYFCKFFNYFKNLMYGYNNISLFNEISREINQFNILNQIIEIPENSEFVDVEILKKCKINYEDLILVDLLLIDAFLLLLTSIKTQNLMIVDVYKAVRDEEEMIEKFYKLYNNETMTNIVVLNFNCLYNYCVKTKEKIIDFVGFFNVSNKIDVLIQKIKNFAKADNGLIAYLYLYNIFNV